MAFPHPQSGKNKNRNKDKPDEWGVVWNLIKRTIDVAKYRNTEDQVNAANDGASGGFLHD